MLVERYQYLSVFFNFWISELFFIFLFPFLAFRFASKFLCFLLSCSLFLFSPSFLFFSLSCFLFFLPSCQHKFSSFPTLVYKTKRDAISSFCLNIQQFSLALWLPAKFLKSKTKDHRQKLFCSYLPAIYLYFSDFPWIDCVFCHQVFCGVVDSGFETGDCGQWSQSDLHSTW